ncbi:MAG TPA: hypothetical protein VGZ26_10895 [Pirellulales bacterium]|nr:hypothetical protein [Pirellulales bacterium]
MKWAAIILALCITAGSSGCWRPYYGQTAPPVYQQAPAFQQAPVYQQAPGVVQQGCQPVVCPPACTPCY